MKAKRLLGGVNAFLGIYGISPLRTVRALTRTPGFYREMKTFKRLLGTRTDWSFGTMAPMLSDRSSEGGTAKGHYFHQDFLVARRIFERAPRKHVDVGSRFDGFVAHVACFREIEFADIRPMTAAIHNVTFRQVDLMSPIEPHQMGICDSLSCLHVLEHLGLGRYGDRVDPDGYKVGFSNLVAMMEPGGILYFAVPMGRQRIVFNAHRIFGLAHLLEMFKAHGLVLQKYSYVDDAGDLMEDVAISEKSISAADSLNYGCGIFELLKDPTVP